MTIVVYHNPQCGTSRNVLEYIRNSGEEPIVIEYLKTGWTKEQLMGLFAAANITAKEALRDKKSPAEELGLLAEDVSNETILNAMAEHPILVNRPIVCSAKGVKLCRPSVEVQALVDGDIGTLS